MSNIFFRIEQLKNQFTETEKKIIDLIQADAKSIIKLNVHELAKLSNASPAAWNRFAKKIGYKGIVELKVELAADGGKSSENEEIDLLLNGSERLDDLVLKYQKICEYAIEDSIKIFDVNALNVAVKTIKRAKRVFIFGVGASSVIAFDFLQKISRIGKTAIFYPDMHLLLSNLSSISEQDVLISISYSGETPEVIFGCDIAKENKAKIICITGYNKNSSLVKKSDIKLFIPLVEKELRVGAITSRNSSLLVTDLLYLGLANEDFNGTLTRLKYSMDKANLLKNRGNK